MSYASDKVRKADTRSEREHLVAYLKYAVEDVAELSPSSASLLVAAIDDLSQPSRLQALGNDMRKPS
jgi:hypothetical protein